MLGLRSLEALDGTVLRIRIDDLMVRRAQENQVLVRVPIGLSLVCVVPGCADVYAFDMTDLPNHGVGLDDGGGATGEGASIAT